MSGRSSFACAVSERSSFACAISEHSGVGCAMSERSSIGCAMNERSSIGCALSERRSVGRIMSECSGVECFATRERSGVGVRHLRRVVSRIMVCSVALLVDTRIARRARHPWPCGERSGGLLIRFNATRAFFFPDVRLCLRLRLRLRLCKVKRSFELRIGMRRGLVPHKCECSRLLRFVIRLGSDATCVFFAPDASLRLRLRLCLRLRLRLCRS